MAIVLLFEAKSRMTNIERPYLIDGRKERGCSESFEDCAGDCDNETEGRDTDAPNLSATIFLFTDGDRSCAGSSGNCRMQFCVFDVSGNPC